MTPTLPAPALLKELRHECAKGHIVEAKLVDPSQHLHGLSDGTRVYVDPRPSIVETLLHELLHRRYPKWSERRVDRQARALLSSLTTRQLNGRYRRYQESVKRTTHAKQVTL